MADTHSTIQDQFSAVYDAYAEELLSFVFYKVSDKMFTEDIVADTFAKLWQKMSQGEIVQNARALLYTIARSLIIDHYRKQDVRKHIPLDEVVDTLVAEGCMMAELDAKSSYERILTAMQSIKPQYADILLLHYVQELSVGEIGEMLLEKENTVRVRLHRALNAIRKKLEV